MPWSVLRKLSGADADADAVANADADAMFGPMKVAGL